MEELRRRLDDPRELRVLAHPVRLRLMQELYARGTATATELAEPVGESPANCSWHLRQLAKHGFVEETGTGRGRERPWRPAVYSMTWGGSAESGETAAASDELSTMLYEQEFATLRAWLAWRRTDPPGWQDAADTTQCLTWLTAGELAELNAELMAVMERHRHLERVQDPSERPPGARRISLFAWAVPAEPMPAEPVPAESGPAEAGGEEPPAADPS